MVVFWWTYSSDERRKWSNFGDIAWSAMRWYQSMLSHDHYLKNYPWFRKIVLQSGIKLDNMHKVELQDKLWAGTQAFREEYWSSNNARYKGSYRYFKCISKDKAFHVTDTVKAPYKFTQDKVQSPPNSSDKTKNTIAQTYWLENQRLEHWKFGRKGVSDAMKKMEAIDKTALKWGGVNSIYDDLHKEIMTWVGKKQGGINLEAQKDKILQSSQ